AYHSLKVQLDNALKSGPRMQVAISYAGGVTIDDNAEHLVPNYKTYEISHFRIERRDNALSVFINGAKDPVATMPLTDIADYDRLRIGGPPGGNHDVTRLYSVKVGTGTSGSSPPWTPPPSKPPELKK